MWLFTTFGFFSIVQKKPSDDFLTVRARAKGDLDQFRKIVPQLSATITSGGTDYPYRAKISHAELGLALANIIRNIDYSNFKNEVSKELGHTRSQQLHEVWQVMHGLTAAENAKPTSNAIAPDRFGGVVLNVHNEILLRHVRNRYGGYVWTFAKGAPKRGETAEQTARREVREELGVDAEIVRVVPGFFRGDTSVTQFFLMRHVRDLGKTDFETDETRWVSLAEAARLLKMTETATGRQRDLDVLAAVKAILRAQHA